jgi:hypothetical protein
MESGTLSAAAACVGATAAAWAALNGSRTLRRVRDDSRERSRPFVVAKLRDVPYADATQSLVVQNVGASVARDLRVTFEPPIADPAGSDGNAELARYLLRRYERPISVLAPGDELDNLYYSGEPGHPGYENDLGFPETVTVRVAYEGPDKHRYEDRFPLDVGLIRHRTYTASPGSPDEVAKRTAKAVESIADSALKIAGRRT